MYEDVVSKVWLASTEAGFLRQRVVRTLRNQSRRRFYITHPEKKLEKRRLDHLRDKTPIGREKKRIRTNAAFRRLRKVIVTKLGDKCVRCGFNDSRALQIDHINGGGMCERKTFASPHGLYRKIRDMPLGEVGKTYQLLCANCNWIKRFERGEH